MTESTNHLLTFELSKTKDQLFIHTNEIGIEFLINELTKLLERVKTVKLITSIL